MNAPTIRESGPRHRIWDMPDGTTLEQRVEVLQQFVRLNAAASDGVKAAMEEELCHEVSSRAAANTDEPLIRTEFEGWTEEELVGEDGFVWGWVLVGRAASYFWPSMAQLDAA